MKSFSSSAATTHSQNKFFTSSKSEANKTLPAMQKGMSLIIRHSLNVDLEHLTRAEHDAKSEAVRKKVGEDYAFDYWSPQWQPSALAAIPQAATTSTASLAK